MESGLKNSLFPRGSAFKRSDGVGDFLHYHLAHSFEATPMVWQKQSPGPAIHPESLPASQDRLGPPFTYVKKR